MSARDPHHIDVAIGARIRLMRNERGFARLKRRSQSVLKSRTITLLSCRDAYLADAQAALGVIGETRIEAFEEAARRAEEFPYEPRKSIAAGIRRLKAPSQTDREEESE